MIDSHNFRRLFVLNRDWTLYLTVPATKTSMKVREKTNYFLDEHIRDKIKVERRNREYRTDVI